MELDPWKWLFPSNYRSKKLTWYSIARQELLAWLNNLLQLNITKVEQCGTGYVDPSL
jgi:hypothetical protein